MTKITMTRNEAVNLYNGVVAAINSNLVGFKFNYALNRTRDLLKSEIDAVIAAQNNRNVELEADTDLKAYEEARSELAKSLATKNEDGTPKIIPSMNGDMYDMSPTASKELEEKNEVLKAKHANGIKHRDESNEKFKAFLAESIEVNVYKIDSSIVPDNINGSLVSILWPILGTDDAGSEVANVNTEAAA